MSAENSRDSDAPVRKKARIHHLSPAAMQNRPEWDMLINTHREGCGSDTSASLSPMSDTDPFDILDEKAGALEDLLWRSSKEGDLAVLRALQKRMSLGDLGYDFINKKDELGITPLMHASKNNHKDACSVLLTMGADVNDRNEKDASALVFAAQRGDLKLVQVFIENCADIKSINTSLIPAAHFGHRDVVDYLIQSGGHANYKNQKGTTALMRAAQEGHSDVVNLLVRSSGEVNEANGEGMTALMLAAQRGHANIVKELIQYGAQVNMQTRQGSTALLLAAKRGHELAVRALVTAGADIFCRDDRHKTARDSAERRGYLHLLDILTMDSQVRLMREAARSERTFDLINLATLHNDGRAHIVGASNSPEYTRLMKATIQLPPPLLLLVAQMIPLPKLWDTQSHYLNLRVSSEAHDVVVDGINILNEILADATINVISRDFLKKHPKDASNKLVLLRDSPCFSHKFCSTGPLAMSDDLIRDLKAMANIQAMLGTFGESNVEFGELIARRVLSLLSTVLEWNEKRRHF